MITQSSISKAQEYLEKAYRFQMDGNLDEAIKNYKLSIEFYPTAEAHTFLGWAYSFLGDLDRSIEECKKAIDIDPDYGNPYNDIGSYLIQQGEYEEAITWLELALKSKRYDSFHFAHLNLGRAYELKGLWFEALDEYKRAIDIAPKYDLAKRLYYNLQGRLN
ncbi:MAG: tetratricopeptide repeat protein [Chlorobi bacterium]|nr:tetratricopeptide repeat protein [Chlorobiota bacterium]MCI0715468.1 tetratricopeptide repeat protein [Chlorobiota bacterium]